MQPFKKGLMAIVALIAITSAALAYIGSREQTGAEGRPGARLFSDGLVTVTAELDRKKVLIGSPGRLSVSLNLAAAEREPSVGQASQPVDLLVVLDRSGSMNGRKINDAKQAVTDLMHRLTRQDRLGLLVYANDVQSVYPLVRMTADNQRRMDNAIRAIAAGGGTNIGVGLKRGIDTFMAEGADGRQRKLILISDGLANQGITDPEALGNMAGTGREYRFAVSTVGVGFDFNELLMTRLADHGGGSYHFLEDPGAFAAVFEKEFQAVRNVAAAGLEIRLPLKDGVRLVDASGYPIETIEKTAVIHPGDLLSGRDRTLFLTFEIPTGTERDFSIGKMEIRYQSDGVAQILAQDHNLTVACVADPEAVSAGIVGGVWEQSVVKEEYSALKEAVADKIRQGKKDEALEEISEYETRNRTLNEKVASSVVSKNLEQDIQQLIKDVRDTFSGAPSAVAEQKKQKAKALQFESYQMRRDKQ